MRNNKGFATSFIIFSLLVLFLVVISMVLFTLSNSSILNSKLKNKLKGEAEAASLYNEYNYYYIGNDKLQIFTAPKKNTYKIEAWSTNNNYTSGKIQLNKGEKLYIYVGSQSSNDGNSDIRTKYNINSSDSIIMKASNSLEQSYISEVSFPNEGSRIIKQNDTTNPNLNKAFVRISYIVLPAANVKYDGNVITDSENVQDVLDKIVNDLGSK